MQSNILPLATFNNFGVFIKVFQQQQCPIAKIGTSWADYMNLQ